MLNGGQNDEAFVCDRLSIDYSDVSMVDSRATNQISHIVKYGFHPLKGMMCRMEFVSVMS